MNKALVFKAIGLDVLRFFKYFLFVCFFNIRGLFKLFLENSTCFESNRTILSIFKHFCYIFLKNNRVLKSKTADATWRLQDGGRLLFKTKSGRTVLEAMVSSQ